jgi:hypothetical protein
MIYEYDLRYCTSGEGGVRGVCLRVEGEGAMGDVVLGTQQGIATPADHPPNLHTPRAVIGAFYDTVAVGGAEVGRGCF